MFFPKYCRWLNHHLDLLGMSEIALAECGVCVGRRGLARFAFPCTSPSAKAGKLHAFDKTVVMNQHTQQDSDFLMSFVNTTACRRDSSARRSLNTGDGGCRHQTA